MEPNEELGKDLMQQAFDLWINPEIERRREAGRLPDDFVLRAAQVVMSLDADAPEVRFNEELKAIAKVQVTRPVEQGEDLYDTDISDIQEIDLTG